MAIFAQKPGFNHFTKMSIFRLFELLVCFSLERHIFVLEYRKSYFPGLYSIRRKVGKTAVFGAITWVNPFGKISIFLLFELLVFIAQKGIFFSRYRKIHFPGLYRLRKNVGKMVLFGPIPWVNLSGKMSVFRLLKLLFFLQPRKALFVLGYPKISFRSIMRKKKSWRNGHFWTKTMI